MRIGGKKLVRILTSLEKMAKPGVNLLQIEKQALFLIKKEKGEASFAKVPCYHWATCLNVNDGLVHGIPRDYQLKKANLLNIDIGFLYKGYHTDLAKSFIVGKQPNYNEKKVFLETGKKALEEAIKLAVEGNFVGHISEVIQKVIEASGYHCAKKYTGHGIGKSLHKPPFIPCILREEIKKTPPLFSGMTLAIEIIYMKGGGGTKVENDGWTVKSDDGGWAACFEKTIAVGKKKATILTPW